MKSLSGVEIFKWYFYELRQYYYTRRLVIKLMKWNTDVEVLPITLQFRPAAKLPKCHRRRNAHQPPWEIPCT